MEINVDLGDFLRARRARLMPEDVGLESGSARRRVRGLRREEVSRLANISSDYYSRLEQGRRINVSTDILGSVARALLLTEEERKHLMQLALSPAVPDSAGRKNDSMSLPWIMEHINETPVATLGRNLEIMEANDRWMNLQKSLTGTSEPGINPANLLLSMRGNSSSASDWELCVRQVAALLRRNVRAFGRDAETDMLIEGLKKESPVFRRLWDEYPIFLNGRGSLRIINSRIGSFEFKYEVFFVSDVSPLTVVVMEVSP